MITLRLFQPGDEKSIAALEKECFSEPWSENGIKESFAAGTLFFVCESQGRTIGYAGLQCIAGEGYITNIAVTAGARRQGVATALLREMETEADKQDLAFITLEVRASNLAARRLYEKFGFVIEGSRKNFYKYPTEDAIIMTKRRKSC